MKNHVAAKVAHVQEALKNTPNSYLGANSEKSATSQTTKSWGPAMRV
jgi:hypothetical protein